MDCVFAPCDGWMICQRPGCDRKIRFTKAGGVDPAKYFATCRADRSDADAPRRPRERTPSRRDFSYKHQPSFCPHLGEPTGESATLYGCGCASSRANGIQVSVYDCALHGECVTNASGTHTKEGVRLCKDCLDNPKNLLKQVKEVLTN